MSSADPCGGRTVLEELIEEESDSGSGVFEPASGLTLLPLELPRRRLSFLLPVLSLSDRSPAYKPPATALMLLWLPSGDKLPIGDVELTLFDLDRSRSETPLDHDGERVRDLPRGGAPAADDEGDVAGDGPVGDEVRPRVGGGCSDAVVGGDVGLDTLGMLTAPVED